MTTNKLTKKECEQPILGYRFDGEGLALFVQKHKKQDGNEIFYKSWKFFFYLNGKKCKMSLGPYPRVSLSLARQKRDEYRTLLAQNIDPRTTLQKNIQKKDKNEEQYLFKNVAKNYFESRKGKINEDSRHLLYRTLELHVLPEIGNKDIRTITRSDLSNLFNKISKKEYRGKPIIYVTHKACMWTGQVFDFATDTIDEKIINHCRRIQKHLPKFEVRNNPHITLKEFPDFLDRLDQFTSPITRAAIFMMLYTGVRTISIRRATWSDLDLENGVWNRKPEKADKNVLRIPLPDQTIELIRWLRPLVKTEPQDLVFPSPLNLQRVMSENCIAHALQKRMNIPMTGHGIRAFVSTALNELFYEKGNDRLIEFQLGHKTKSSVEGVYNKYDYLKERAVIMQRWADYIDNILKKNKQKRKKQENKNS